jgi:hypothetical protein
MVGHAFTIESDLGDPDAGFRDSCDSSGAAVGSTFGAAGGESGVVPEGAACILAWEFVGGPSVITMTII